MFPLLGLAWGREVGEGAGREKDIMEDWCKLNQ